MARSTWSIPAGVVIALLMFGCSDDSSTGGSAPPDEAGPVGVVPFEMIPVTTPPSVPPGSVWDGVSVEVESTPSTAEPGGLLEFVVSISNPSADAIDLRQFCPAYFMNFGESSESAVPVISLLNCDEADPLPAGGSERFAMEIEIPRDLQLDAGSVYWRLEPALADATSPEIVVESSA